MRWKENHWRGVTLFSLSERRDLCTEAGDANLHVVEEKEEGWICILGSNP